MLPRADEDVNIVYNVVGPRYFETIGTRVVRGRAFDQRDTLTYIEREPTLLRPLNMPSGTPGRGANLIEARNGRQVLVINALMLQLVAYLVPGFAIETFWAAFWAALIISPEHPMSRSRARTGSNIARAAPPERCSFLNSRRPAQALPSHALRWFVLHEFVAANRDEIISRCRAKVATRSIPPGTGPAVSDRGLVAIGRRPVTQGIGLENTDVTISDLAADVRKDFADRNEKVAALHLE